MLATSFPLPPYTAVMECDPAASVAMLRTAVPPLSALAPIVAAPSLNVTVPAAVPPKDWITVAVKVTVLPNVDGFTDANTDVEVSDLIVNAVLLLLSMLPATSLLWKTTVWLPVAETENGPA